MMTEQQLQEIEASHYRMPVVLALIAEIRRLREQQGRELIARVDAIEQGNSLAQRLIEQRDTALADRLRAALAERDKWQRASVEMCVGSEEDLRLARQELQQLRTACWQLTHPLPCTWTEQPLDADFATTCGHAFQFAHDPPYDYVKICCYCGKPVVFVAAPPEKEDPDE